MCVLFSRLWTLTTHFCEDELVASTTNTENYDEQISKHNSNLEKWEKSNKFGKMIIKQSISVAIRGVLPCIKNDGELSAKEFLNSIEENYKVDDYANFLINNRVPHIRWAKW